MSAALDRRSSSACDRARMLGVLSTSAATLEMKREALARLEPIADPYALDALAELAEDAERELRTQLTLTLQRLGGPQRWMDLLDHPRPDRRAAAARHIGVMRVYEAVPALVAHLDDRDDRVREQIAGALVRLRDPRAIEALEHHLVEDPSPDVRGACAQALGELGCLEALTRAAETEQDPFTVILIERSLWRLEEREAASG